MALHWWDATKSDWESRASFPDLSCVAVLIPEEWRLEKASQLRKFAVPEPELAILCHLPLKILQEVSGICFAKGDGRREAAICKFGGTDIYRKIEISKCRRATKHLYKYIWDLVESIPECRIVFWY